MSETTPQSPRPSDDEVRAHIEQIILDAYAEGMDVPRRTALLVGVGALITTSAALASLADENSALHAKVDALTPKPVETLELDDSAPRAPTLR